ncbi:hypothetical protein D3C76_1468460 [compost metagenome]
MQAQLGKASNRLAAAAMFIRVFMGRLLCNQGEVLRLSLAGTRKFSRTAASRTGHNLTDP